MASLKKSELWQLGTYSHMAMISCFLEIAHEFSNWSQSPVRWLPDAKSWLIRKPWCWERSKAGGEGDDRGWDGWMASLTQWTWVWTSSRRWWGTGKPGLLQSIGLQRVGYNLVTKQQESFRSDYIIDNYMIWLYTKCSTSFVMWNIFISICFQSHKW